MERTSILVIAKRPSILVTAKRPSILVTAKAVKGNCSIRFPVRDLDSVRVASRAWVHVLR
jgi:hypothetical protein